MDGKGELYFGTSPYVYASNTPIQAIDPDGNVVIFINGMHFGDDATPQYWRTSYKKEYSTAYGPMTAIMPVNFDTQVMNRLGDLKALYYDGAMGGGAVSLLRDRPNTNPLLSSNRIDAGYEKGKTEAKGIIDNLARDKTTGEIVETIKIITHSMGRAYAKGFVKTLQEYIKTLPKEQQYQIKITLVADFDPFQGAS